MYRLRRLLLRAVFPPFCVFRAARGRLRGAVKAWRAFASGRKAACPANSVSKRPVGFVCVSFRRVIDASYSTFLHFFLNYFTFCAEFLSLCVPCVCFDAFHVNIFALCSIFPAKSSLFVKKFRPTRRQGGIVCLTRPVRSRGRIRAACTRSGRR